MNHASAPSPRLYQPSDRAATQPATLGQAPPWYSPQTWTSYPFRLGVFGVAVGVLYHFIAESVVAHGPSIGREGGPIENAQAIAAALAAGLFVVASIRTRIGVVGLATCAAVTAYAAGRESDALLESLLFDDAYKYLVGLPAVTMLGALAWRHRRTAWPETLTLLNHPAATLFILAGIYLAFVCQTLDRPLMWPQLTSASGENRVLIEETVELFAYLTMAFSASESIWFSQSTRTKAAATHESEARRQAA